MINTGLGSGAKSCNPSYLGGRDWEDCSLGLLKTPSQPMTGCSGIYMASSHGKKHLENKARPYLKNKQHSLYVQS
jgi:hypothetical protein